MKFHNPIYLVLVLSLSILGLASKAIAEVESNLSSQQLEIAQQNQDDAQEEEPEKVPELEGIPKDINEIAEKITVRIDSPNSNGSGVIFAKKGDEYYVVTAKHVVEQEQNYQIVTEDEKVYEIKSADIEKIPDNDLAILSFSSGKNYQVAAFSNYNIGLNKNFSVFVYGWVKTDKEPETLLTVGKVVGKETGIFLVKDDLSLTKTNGYELVYTNISEKGMSGGPVIDTNGRVIGIHTSAEGERYRLINKLQLGFSLGIPIATFLNSDTLKSLVASRSLEIQTIKEKLDLVLFSIPSLSQKDLNSIPTNFLESPNSRNNETEWVNYGNKLWRASRYPEAVAAFDRAIAYETNFYQAHYGKGLALYDLGNYEEAVSAFKQATDLQADFYPAWYRQSLSLLNLKKYDQALAVVQKAIALKPENTPLYALKGEALENLSQYNDALASYNKAIAMENNPLLLTRRSSLYRILEQYELALNDLNRAIKSEPRYTEGYINRGLTYYQLGNYQQALTNFDRVLLIDRQDPRAFLGRGFVKHKLGETTQAKADFNHAFQLYMQETEAKQEANDINLQPNQYGQVATDFHYIMQLNSEEGNICLGQGIVNLLSNNKPKAIKSFVRANQLFETERDKFSQWLTQQFLTQIRQKTLKPN
jgi:tetratricopeptide (TPR) repeat protein